MGYGIQPQVQDALYPCRSKTPLGNVVTLTIDPGRSTTRSSLQKDIQNNGVRKCKDSTKNLTHKKTFRLCCTEGLVNYTFYLYYFNLPLHLIQLPAPMDRLIPGRYFFPEIHRFLRVHR